MFVGYEDYRNIFMSFVNNNMFSETVLLYPSGITEDEQIKLFEELSLDLQIGFCKNVYLISSKEDIKSDMIIQKGYDPALIVSEFDVLNTVFLVDVNIPYYNVHGSWEYNIINQLGYYKYTLFGFSNKQIIKIYQD